MIFKHRFSGLFGSLSAREGMWLFGAVFLNGDRLSLEEVHKYFKCSIQKENLADKMRELNGFFCLVALFDGDVYIVSDKIRSIPVFYSFRNNNLCVSDSTDWLRADLNQPTENQLASEEFLTTGYVTGRETLINQISQVQSSEIVIFKDGEKEFYQTYYSFFPSNPALRTSYESYEKQVDEVMKMAVERLVDFAGNRQIIIPLSGGYDSRALAIYVKQTGYKNIATFTFGKRKSPEVLISKKVAAELDLPWHFVEYTPSLWRKVKGSMWFEDYIHFINSLVSVPNVHVLPAIKQLVEGGVFDLDCIIVPGHAADFLAGSHLATIASRACDWSIAGARDFILKKHYVFNRKSPLSKELSLKVESQVVFLWDFLSDELSDKNKFMAVCEAWNYRERQAKFIANSNRYYDFFDLKWWMPFWDNEFIAAWQSVPLELRVEEKLWVSLVNNKMSEFTGETSDLGHATKNANTLVRVFRKLLNYFMDPNYLYTLVPFEVWLLSKLKLSKSDGSLFGFLSQKTLRLVLKK